jgi:allantoicase
MDGWESRRKRTPGNDWCVIELATTGYIYGFDIDTNHFLGNAPLHASVQGVFLNHTPTEEEIVSDKLDWVEILPKITLQPGSQNEFDCLNHDVFSHLRLHIFPDGGVARFRAYGKVFKKWDAMDPEEEIDLGAAINGGKSIHCNDMFFSSMDNLIMPGRGVNMGDGWETKRNRTPNNCDWVIIKLATKGQINRIVVDTKHFKGNYPDSCMIEGCSSNQDEAVLNNQVEWFPLLPNQKLEADTAHIYTKIEAHEEVTHVRLNIYPDGGVSRLRLYGKIIR